MSPTTSLNPVRITKLRRSHLGYRHRDRVDMRALATLLVLTLAFGLALAL